MSALFSLHRESLSWRLPVLAFLATTLATLGAPTLKWVPEGDAPPAFRVELSSVDFDPKTADFKKLLAVRVADQATKNAPPMAGSYSFSDRTLIFRPAFPLQPGLRYLATSNSLQAEFTAPDHRTPTKGSVTHITPSAKTLPLNLLKFYLHFSTPMTRGDIYQFIVLKDARGKIIPDPFLELPEELWNPEMTRLTILLDPGRIKRGLRPNKIVGSVLQANQEYTLTISANWMNASGRPLTKSFTKSFLALAPDYKQPTPAKWRYLHPEAGTIAALRITFGEPLDAALAVRLITVHASAGEVVSGSVKLSQDESVWEFTPDRPWTNAQHELRIDHRLEDLVGNSIDRPFEDALDKHPERAGDQPGTTTHRFVPRSLVD